MLESKFQARLIVRLREMFPGCVILKNDPSYLLGILDLSIFYGDRWAMLECKAELTSKLQPGQPYYLQLLNEMSYAAIICPENEEEILREVQQALAP